jgi:hypothetical protein
MSREVNAMHLITILNINLLKCDIIHRKSVIGGNGMRGNGRKPYQTIHCNQKKFFLKI